MLKYPPWYARKHDAQHTHCWSFKCEYMETWGALQGALPVEYMPCSALWVSTIFKI